mmetsp:Transcript_31105/g.64014  ORF Transcript_31105/g.64014 Transcript_31105/m.64014 type:complete len:99 (-) Transcript_31105:1344-1640(-)
MFQNSSEFSFYGFFVNIHIYVMLIAELTVQLFKFMFSTLLLSPKSLILFSIYSAVSIFSFPRNNANPNNLLFRYSSCIHVIDTSDRSFSSDRHNLLII